MASNITEPHHDPTDDQESIMEINFNIMDDDDDILALAEETANAASSDISNNSHLENKDMAIDLEGIDFDEQIDEDEAANISIGLENGQSVDQQILESGGCNSGFDFVTGKLWIYPTNYPVRDYQYNIVQQALYKNTLVVLPTGLGKTFIAAVVMCNLYRWFPMGKIVFMAPTKPLVAQQIQACYNIMAIPKADTVEMTGTMPPATRLKAWKEKRVVFLTPQVMTNDLSRGSCTAESIKCLVVDEAHKALGNHAYCQVVRELVKFTREFRILALSATPGGDLKAVQQVMNNLLISHIELRSEDSIDIHPYTHERKVEKIIVPLGEELTRIRSQYIQIMTCVVQRLIRNRVLYNREATKLSKFLILKARDEFRQNPPQNLQQIQFGNIEADFALAMSLYHGFELLQLHGLRSLYNFFMGIISGEKGYGRTRSELMRNADFNSIMETLRQKFPGPGALGISTSSDCKVAVGHPKMQRLEEIVVKHFETFQKKGEETRVMIFSQYRDSVQEIAAILNQHQPLVKVMPFIGQSSAGKTAKGYTQKEQLKVMRQFREGGYNTLVSTCVGEEGLDIGDVDLIVCFDAHKSPIRLVQRMGRTGRKRQGRIVMLMTEGKEEQIYNQSLYSKKSIHKAILNGARSLHFYPKNPRMIPHSVIPQCHKMHITVAPAAKSKANTSSNVKTRTRTDRNGTISDIFGKQKKKKVEDQFLTAAEYEEIKYEFSEALSIAKHLPKPRCITLSSKSEVFQENSDRNCVQDPNVIKLSEWMPWQNRLQNTHIVGHSIRSVHLVKTSEFIEIQNCIGEEEDNYGNEMRLYLNKDDIFHSDIHGQSSINSFLVPMDSNVERERGGIEEPGHVSKNLGVETGRGKKMASSSSYLHQKVEDIENDGSAIISREDDSEEVDVNAITKPKESRLFTTLKDNSSLIDTDKFKGKKGKKVISKSKKKGANTPSSKGNPNVIKLRNKKKNSEKTAVLRNTQKAKEKLVMKQKWAEKRKSVMEILGNDLMSTQDSVDFEDGCNDEATCDNVKNAKEEISIEKWKKKNTIGEEMSVVECNDVVVNDYVSSDVGMKNDLFKVRDAGNDLVKSNIDRMEVTDIKEMDAKEEIPMIVPPAPPIAEIKGLFSTLKSGSDFQTLDLETLVDNWNKSERETCASQTAGYAEFISDNKGMNSKRVSHSDLMKKHFPDVSVETQLLKDHSISSERSTICANSSDCLLDRGSILVLQKETRKSLSCPKDELFDKQEQKVPSVLHTAKEFGKSHNDNSHSSQKSPSFKSLTNKLQTERPSEKVVKPLLFHKEQILDSDKMKVSVETREQESSASEISVGNVNDKSKEQNHWSEGLINEDCHHENINLANLSVFFNSVMEDHGEAEYAPSHLGSNSKAFYNTLYPQSIVSPYRDGKDEMLPLTAKNPDEIVKTVGNSTLHSHSARKQAKCNDTFITFTQALDCLQTSSSENSPEVHNSTPNEKGSNVFHWPGHKELELQSERQQLHTQTKLLDRKEQSNGEMVGYQVDENRPLLMAESKTSLLPHDYQTSPHTPRILAEKEQEKRTTLSSDLHTSTPQKNTNKSDSDCLTVPDFDLGFDLDDDVIPPTPEKNVSCALSVHTETHKPPAFVAWEMEKMARDLDTCKKIPSVNEAIEGFDDGDMIDDSDLMFCEEIKHMDQMQCDTEQEQKKGRSPMRFPINDYPKPAKLELSKNSSDTEAKNDTERCNNVRSSNLTTASKFILIDSPPEAELWKSVSPSLPNDFVKSRDIKTNLEWDNFPASRKRHNSEKVSMCSTLIAKSEMGQHQSPSAPILLYDISTPSSPEKPALPFRQYTSNSSFDQINSVKSAIVDSHQIQPGKERKIELPNLTEKSDTKKLRLGKRKSRFYESVKTDDKMPVTETVNKSKNDKNHSGKVTSILYNVTSNENDKILVSEAISIGLEDKSRNALSHLNRHSDQLYNAEKLACGADRGNSMLEQDVFVRERNVGTVRPMSHKEIAASTPVRPSQQRNVDFDDKEMQELTPIKGFPSLAGFEEDKEDSEDSFIRRRKKKPIFVSDTSTTDTSVEKTPKRSYSNGKVGTSSKQSDSPAAEGKEKTTSHERKALSVLGISDNDDDMDDFEDSHSVLIPFKQVPEVKDKKRRRGSKGIDFVEKEAEVSGDNASTDEDEDMDYYECSFIDNNTEMTQTQGADMRAMYLKSVKSPPVGGQPGAFKLQFNNRHNDVHIYSQTLAEDYGMSDYEEDSFCVGSGEEEISYEDATIEKEIHNRKRKTASKDKKLKQGAGKRRIKMLSQSSSEDEQRNHIQMTQEFSACFVRAGRKVLLSSSEDENERRNPSTLGTQTFENDSFPPKHCREKGPDALSATQISDKDAFQKGNMSSESKDIEEKLQFSVGAETLKKNSTFSEHSLTNKKRPKNSEEEDVPALGNFNLFNDDDWFEELAVSEAKTSVSKVQTNEIQPSVNNHKFLSLKNKNFNQTNKMIEEEKSIFIEDQRLSLVCQDNKIVKSTSSFSVSSKNHGMGSISSPTNQSYDIMGHKVENRNENQVDQTSSLADQQYSYNFKSIINSTVKSSGLQKSEICEGQSFTVNSKYEKSPILGGESTNVVSTGESATDNTRQNKAGAVSSREERLRKQKEKQERFRQRLKQMQNITSSTSSNVSPTAVSSKAASSVLTLGDTRPASDDCGGKNDEHVGCGESADSKVSPVFSKSAEDRRREVQLQVLVSPKAISSAQDIISALRQKYEIKVIARQLPACDFILSNHLAVDRVQWSVFSNSSNRSKLSTKLCELQALYDRCVLVVETDRPKAGQEKAKRPQHHTKYLDTTLAYLAQSRIKVYYSNNVDETAALLAELCRVEGRKGRALTVPAVLTPKKEEMMDFMLSIPKVTVPQALNLAHKYRTIAELIASPAAVLEEQDCMTRMSAQSLYSFLHHSFDLQMMPNFKR